MTQPSHEAIKELLPYLEWIDIFHEIHFREWFRIPVSEEDYHMKSRCPDIGFLYWYSAKTGKTQKVTFCMKEYAMLEKPLIKSTIGELINAVNVYDETIPWYYLYRIKNQHIRDAIRISFKQPVDKMALLPEGFHISNGFTCHDDQSNLARIQQWLDENRTITLVATYPKKDQYLRLYNRVTESVIYVKGPIPEKLLQECKRYGFRDRSRPKGSE